MGEIARDQAQGAPLGQGTGKKMLEKGSGGTGWKKKATSSPSLTPTTQLGPEPCAQEAWGHQGVPCVLEGTEMGNRSWKAWSLPQVPRGQGGG